MTSPMTQEVGPQHSFLVGLFQPLFLALDQLGLQLDDQVAAGGADTSDPLGRYPLDPTDEVWDRVDQIDPLVGLRAPGFARPSNFYALGVAGESSETVLDAFRLGERYTALLYQGEGVFSVEERACGYRVVIDSDSVPHVAMDFIQALACGVYRYLAGEQIMALPGQGFRDVLLPLDAQLRRPAPRPEHLEAYRKVFGQGVRFGAGRNQLDFPRETFERRRLSANPTLLAFSEQLAAEAMAKGIDGAFAVQVGRVIEQLLPEGEPRLGDVAAALNMSSRSLQRRLELEGVSFGEIRQQTKLDLARLYLEQSSKPMSDIAYLLGFSSHSSFSRAFSMWTGESPSAARARARLAARPEPVAPLHASA